MSTVIDRDLGWKEIVRDHKKLDGISINVGLFGDGEIGRNVAARGAVHEFGVKIKVTEKMRRFLMTIGIFLKATTTTINIPSRPFTRSAFDKGVRKLISFVQKTYGLMVDDKISPKRFLNQIGIFHTNQIKQSIRGGNWTPLHPATIEQKGSTKPLIDTGTMLNSVKHKITKKV